MKRATLIQTSAITLAIIAAFLMGPSATLAQADTVRQIAAASDDWSSNDLVGVWEAVNVPAENDCTTGAPIPGVPIIRVLNTFNLGGTGWLEDTANYDGPYRSTGATIWKRTSGRNYTYVNVHYAFEPDKTFKFIIKQRANLTLSRDGDSFKEKGTFDVILPDGTIVYSGCFQDEARRMKF